MKKILLLFTLLAPHFCYSMESFDIPATTLPKHKLALLSQKAEPSRLHWACMENYWYHVQGEIAKPDCAINKRARMNFNINASTPLYVACQHGHTNIVELLLTAKGIKVNKGDLIESYGKPLHVAKKPAIAKLLIENGANINATNGIAGQTPLIKHILAWRTDVARYLIKAGADVHHKDMDGHTALFYALQSDNRHPKINDAIDTIIFELLEASANFIQDAALILKFDIELLAECLPLLKKHFFHIFSLKDPLNENNPIFFLQNNAALLKYLYNQSNDPDPESGTKKDNKKNLYHALDVVKHVLRAASSGYSDEPDVSKRAACLYGRLFLYDAMRQDLETLFGKKSISYVQFLLHLKELFKCIKKNKPSRIENILKLSLWGSRPTDYVKWCGKNMDDIHWCGNNMIEYAFKHKTPKCLKALFSSYPQYDAWCCDDVNEFYSRFDLQLLQPKNDEQCRLALQESLCTELQFAIAKQNFDEVKRLIELGIDVNAYNEGGDVPLHVAAGNQHDDNRFVDLLIKAGADVNLKNGDKYARSYQKTPLIFAAKRSKSKIVRSLLKAGADINCFPLFSYIESLLFSPINNKKISLVKELIENGIYIHQEYGELAEKGWPRTGTSYDCTKISTMLEKAYKDPAYPYKDPHCCICLEYCVDDIPCVNEHERSFLCAECCSAVKAATNKCPLCREQLQKQKADNDDDDDDEIYVITHNFVNNFGDGQDSESEESLDGFALF